MTDGFISRKMLDVLTSKDPELASCLLAMEDRALKDWIPLLVPDKGSHSGLVHLYNVGRDVDKMIPDEKKQELTAGEIFLLLAAVLLHDIGRIIPEPKDGRKPACGAKDEAVPCNVPAEERPCHREQWDHFEKSRKIIEDEGQALGLPHDIAAKYCAILAWCHGLAKPPREPQPKFLDVRDCPLKHELEDVETFFRNTSIEPLGPVRIPLLAALLRIADETENHWTRALNQRWMNMFPKDKPGSDEKSYPKLFRRHVEDVEFCQAGRCIIFHLGEAPDDPELLRKYAGITRTVEQTIQEKDGEQSWGHELRPLGIQFNRVLFEVKGRLQRIEFDKDEVKEIDKPMEVMAEDADLFRTFGAALVRLSGMTLGYENFGMAALEAEVGRPLKDRDKWLIERMADWWPEVISMNHHKQLVHIVKEKTNVLVHDLQLP